MLPVTVLLGVFTSLLTAVRAAMVLTDRWAKTDLTGSVPIQFAQRFKKLTQAKSTI